MTVLVQHRRQAVLDVQESEWKGCTSMAADESKNSVVQAQTELEAAGLHPTVQAAKEWFDSSEGRSRSRNLVSRNGYPISAEELRDEALARVWVRMQRHPDKPIEDIEKYCQRVMANLCMSAGKARFFTVDLEDDESGTTRLISERSLRGGTPGFDVDHTMVSELVRRLRSAIETLEGSPQVKSAALNYLTLSLYPETDCSDLPSPKRGATQLQARWWHAVALALQTPDLFPGADASPAAQRQRLRRCLLECQGTLDRAHVDVARKEFGHE